MHIKGIVHQEMKIQSLSTHPHADDKMKDQVKVFFGHKTLLEFHREKELQ